MRANGYAGEIVVVGDEPHPPYSRPPLSKEALAGEPAFDRLAFRVRAAAADVVWRLGVRAEHADLDARQVVLAGGEVIRYDVLVAATGVSARRLPIPGPPPDAAAGRHVVRTLEDAVALRRALVPGARVVVLGAGFIGCEVAATARTLGCEVHAAALDDLPMIRPLGPELAAELQRRHEAQGVVFHLGRGVASFLGERRVEGVVLDDGTALAADVVVEALGSRPNTDLLAGNGLDLSDGVLTDAALRPLRGGSPVDGVAVVGDLARFPNPRFDAEARRVEHWSVPTDTGRRAGAVLAAHLAGVGYARGRRRVLGSAAGLLVRPVRHPAAVVRDAGPGRPGRDRACSRATSAASAWSATTAAASSSAWSGSACCARSTPTAPRSATPGRGRVTSGVRRATIGYSYVNSPLRGCLARLKTRSRSPYLQALSSRGSRKHEILTRLAAAHDCAPGRCT